MYVRSAISISPKQRRMERKHHFANLLKDVLLICNYFRCTKSTRAIRRQQQLMRGEEIQRELSFNRFVPLLLRLLRALYTFRIIFIFPKN